MPSPQQNTLSHIFTLTRMKTAAISGESKLHVYTNWNQLKKVFIYRICPFIFVVIPKLFVSSALKLCCCLTLFILFALYFNVLLHFAFRYRVRIQNVCTWKIFSTNKGLWKQTETNIENTHSTHNVCYDNDENEFTIAQKTNEK